MTAEQLVGGAHQRNLFASNFDSLLTFIDLSKAREADLKTILTTVRPNRLVDLRVAPRFDYGSLNRKRAFDLFDQTGIQYVDYCAITGARTPDHSSLSAAEIASFVI